MSKTLRPLATLVALAMISAGCSNASSDSASRGASGATHRDQAVKFAACMRNNGVTEFPDPNANGEFAYGIKLGSSLDPSSTTWKKAIAACKDQQPAGFMSNGKADAQVAAARLKFAACMRQNGVKDFPDPAPDGPLINVQHAQSIPGFQAALQKCRTLLPAGIAHQ